MKKDFHMNKLIEDISKIHEYMNTRYEEGSQEEKPFHNLTEIYLRELMKDQRFLNIKDFKIVRSVDKAV